MRALPPGLRQALELEGRGLTILILRFGALGDVVRTLPAVRTLRRGAPRARLVWAVDEPWAVMLEHHRDLDAVLPFPRPAWNRLAGSPLGWPGLVPALRRWRGRLRQESAGLTLDFQGNLRSGVNAVLSGAPVRVGYAGHWQREGNRLFSTHRVPAGERRAPRPERNLALVRALGVAGEPETAAALEVAADARAGAREAAARALDGAAGAYAVIAAGVSRRQHYKKPPAELLASAGRRLAERGIHPIVVYGPGERGDAEGVVAAAAGAARLCPPTTLPVLAALMREARLFVGGDTGPMHIACAVGCPVLALYGPTDPRINRPWAVPHVAVAPAGRRYTGVKSADRRAGFEGLTAEMVRGAVDRLLEQTGG